MAIDEIRAEKIKKIEELRKVGIDPYPTFAERTHTTLGVLENFDKLSKDEETVTLAGRVMAMREHGGSAFFDVADHSGSIQGHIKEDVIGKKLFELFKGYIAVGDFIEATGTLFETKRGEKTLETLNFKLLTKAILPLPEKWHGLQDVEERYRKRYLDLITNPEVKEKFIKRAKIIENLRNFLVKNEFIEVTTPTLQPLYGGASARPFKTHFNALDQDMFLRIAPELYLKRLLVGGLEKVFEFTTNFRNEGIDREHNPEFSALEFYAAYKDYNWAMDFIEDMFHELDPELFKKPFKRVKYEDLMKEHNSLDDTVFKEKVRPKLIEPVFVKDYPKSMLPLAKLKPGTDMVEAFQFYTGGFELVKAFTELNDPIDQHERFRAQENLRAKGDEEAQRMDEDYIEALEYGMPPAAGVGIGIDRLVVLLTKSRSIREVILFPTMKPKE